ncbi:unnamed protein product [Symbiodinium sp. CCMP2592]|nr:unnamed protein product [Symbiodinium sp. CCMP2592]
MDLPSVVGPSPARGLGQPAGTARLAAANVGSKPVQRALDAQSVLGPPPSRGVKLPTSPGVKPANPGRQSAEINDRRRPSSPGRKSERANDRRLVKMHVPSARPFQADVLQRLSTASTAAPWSDCGNDLAFGADVMAGLCSTTYPGFMLAFLHVADACALRASCCHMSRREDFVLYLRKEASLKRQDFLLSLHLVFVCAR